MKTLSFTARDFRQQEQTVTVKGRLVHSDGAVSLVQTRKAGYVVVYGLQVSHVLDYRLAAIEYGQCVFHALACDGKLFD